jgi:hypothetical protein
VKIITNEPLIRRNKKLGQYVTFASLGILAAGMYVSFAYPQQLLLSWGALVVGFVLSQVGIYYGNRWGRSPRPDEQLTSGLKGIDSQNTLYHYSAPVPHLLIGPTGVWVLIPYHQRGKISYEKGRFRQRGGNAFLRIFGQEGIGRPEMEANSQVQDILKSLSKSLPEEQMPPVQGVLVFTNEKAEIDLDDAPLPAVSLKKLKEFVRKKPKDGLLSQDRLRSLNQLYTPSTIEETK